MKKQYVVYFKGLIRCSQILTAPKPLAVFDEYSDAKVFVKERALLLKQDETSFQIIDFENHTL